MRQISACYEPFKKNVKGILLTLLMVQSVFSTPLYQNFEIVKLLLKSDEPEEPNFCDFSCITITTHAL